MSINVRIKQERERLGYSQATLATALEVHANSLSNWENGHALPNADILAGCARLGFDVQYVITGKHSGSALSDNEQALIAAYRRANDDLKEHFMLLSEHSHQQIIYLQSGGRVLIQEMGRLERASTP